MAMTEQEAFKLISLVSDSYNMEFNETKYQTWSSVLIKEGHYESSLRKLKKYIKESQYKPTLADVLAIKPQGVVMKETPIEETHEYKVKHDAEYAEEWRKIQERGRAFIRELRSND
ncbi:TPA: hypothetical protein I1677_001259 [Staphylococcus pseudintermedius]|nr:hypothetical protein [Staphylococcus pseudintermedius]